MIPPDLSPIPTPAPGDAPDALPPSGEWVRAVRWFLRARGYTWATRSRVLEHLIRHGSVQTCADVTCEADRDEIERLLPLAAMPCWSAGERWPEIIETEDAA